MKRGLQIAGVLLLGLLVLFVVTHFEPRRVRPEGWHAAWATVVAQPESQWAIDPLTREVMQRLFLQVGERLSHCSAEYVRAELPPVELELFLEADAQGPHILYVLATPSGDVPAGLVPCLERALEQTTGVPHTGIAAGTRWRILHTFLLHRPDELPQEPWYEPFIPDSLKSGGTMPVYMG